MMEHNQREDALTIVFLGRSGCGKGTQAKMLIDYLKKNDSTHPLLYISTGEELRKFWQGNNYSQNISKSWNEEGDLQPSFIPIFTWSKFLIENSSGNEHWIFDGSPRRLNESQIMGSAFKFYERMDPIILYIDVSDGWARERLIARGRSDDKDLNDIKKRLEWFERDTKPVIDSLSKRNDFRLIKVNGEQSIEDVHKEIIDHLFNSQ